MPKSYTVAEGQEFTYPADANTLQIIRSAGGVSQLTPEQRARCKFKTVGAGQDCSDMPEPALGIYLERGWVISTESKFNIFKKDEVKE